jgi:hypothetical protein
MEHVWQKVAELRAQYGVLREDSVPIDVFAFAEIDLQLDPIPFDDDFSARVKGLFPNFATSGEMRDQFADQIAPRFGVSSQVIAVRLDRDSIWPAS